MKCFLSVMALSGCFSAVALASDYTVHNINSYAKIAVSYDPWEAWDQENLQFAQSYFAQPIVTNQKGALGSLVFESFRHQKSEKRLILKVKKGLLFSDGTPLSVEDVAFSMVRVAKKYESNALMREIVGIKEWLGSKDLLAKLPSGMTVKENTIEISLSHEMEHPFYYMTSPHYSVIPRRCMNSATLQLACAEPPASGPYVVESRQGTSGITFKLRPGFQRIFDKKLPPRLILDAVTTEKIPENMAKIEKNSVVFFLSTMIDPELLKQQQGKLEFRPFSPVNLSGYVLNPNVEPWKKVECRQYMASEFHKTALRIYDSAMPVERGSFTNFTPGYLSARELEKTVPSLTKAEQNDCLERVRSAGIRWAHTHDRMNVARMVMNETLVRLRLPPAVETLKVTWKEYLQRLLGGQSSVGAVSTEMHPQNFVDNLRSFFQSDENSPISLVTTPSVKAALSRLFAVEANPTAVTKEARNLNETLFGEAIYVNLVHPRFALLAPKGETYIQSIPESLTQVPPWQMFDVK